LKRTYSALRIRQTEKSAELVLFAAPATDIDDWSGVPQRERLGEDESAGFQREESPKRVGELQRFYSDPKNVIQNPLLCASRDDARVRFKPAGDSNALILSGEIEVEWDDLREIKLLDLFRRLRDSLLGRMPDMQGRVVGDHVLSRLRQRANADYPQELVNDYSESEDVPEPLDETDSNEDLAAALFGDETHIAEFWEEVAGRAQILSELSPSLDPDEFLGFSKEAMRSYLQPVVLVDGQHRLRGALDAATEAVNSDENRGEIETAISRGDDPDDVSDRIRRRSARLLPVSLLLETSPAEHVFQFVVVNQKATPIGRALLGTIVSTSLTAGELASVSDRLTTAGIPLEDSRAIAYLTRHSESPFKGLVEKGLSDDGADVLQWNVLGSLIRIFRELKGGRLFHERLDYADKWRRSQLDASNLVSAGSDIEAKMKIWSAADGPWRDVFIGFFAALRDSIGNASESDAGNYWGAPRKSNLFNKISLTILAADFFQFLCDKGYGIDSADEVSTYVSEWLRDVSPTYFARDWKLSGVKKDAPGIRAQWSYLWVQYRKDPVRNPALGEFRKSRST
jgi:hypothetical protein